MVYSHTIIREQIKGYTYFVMYFRKFMMNTKVIKYIMSGGRTYPIQIIYISIPYVYVKGTTGTSVE